MPKTEPEWNPNTRAGRTFMKQYQELILYGIQNGVPKQRNIAKPYEVKQDPNENPPVFYERLCEAAKKWTDFNPENENTRLIFYMLFIE